MHCTQQYKFISLDLQESARVSNRISLKKYLNSKSKELSEVDNKRSVELTVLGQET